MARRFAIVREYQDRDIAMPVRHTRWSAGYDLCAAEAVELGPGEVALVPTGVKAYMPPGEVLKIYIRSSMAVKRGLRLANQVGVIDADYVDNPDNEGHIFIPLENASQHPVHLAAGERIAQGIFETFRITDDDDMAVAEGKTRQGGFGSTGA